MKRVLILVVLPAERPFDCCSGADRLNVELTTALNVVSQAFRKARLGYGSRVELSRCIRVRRIEFVYLSSADPPTHCSAETLNSIGQTVFTHDDAIAGQMCF